jgi:NADPH-dependent curcumin reductase CurA
VTDYSNFAIGEAYLGVLGMTGLAARVGLDLVDVKAGDRVVISAAAGAVGSVAGQLAKLRGCRVVGSTGSQQKVKELRAKETVVEGFERTPRAFIDLLRGGNIGRMVVKLASE